jgi:hypothetical protein
MRRAMLSLVAALIAATAASAEEPARTLDELRRLTGPVVYVRDTAGNEMKGRLVQISDSGIMLLTDGITREIPQPEIAKIDRHGDSVRDGAVIGAALGAIGYIAVARADGVTANIAALPVAVFFYAAMGAGIDAMITRRTEIYRAPSLSAASAPPVTHQGVMLAIRKRW